MPRMVACGRADSSGAYRLSGREWVSWWTGEHVPGCRWMRDAVAEGICWWAMPLGLVKVEVFGPQGGLVGVVRLRPYRSLVSRRGLVLVCN